jgi:hypothetical protein
MGKKNKDQFRHIPRYRKQKESPQEINGKVLQNALQFAEYHLRASFVEQLCQGIEFVQSCSSLLYSICFAELLFGGLMANIAPQQIQNYIRSDNTNDNPSLGIQFILTIAHMLYQRYSMPQTYSTYDIKNIDSDNLAKIIDQYLLEFELSRDQKHSLESAEKYYEECHKKLTSFEQTISSSSHSHQHSRPKFFNIHDMIIAFLIRIVLYETHPDATNIILSSIFIPIFSWLTAYLLTPIILCYLMLTQYLSGQRPSAFIKNGTIAQQYTAIIPFLNDLLAENFTYTIQPNETLETLKKAFEEDIVSMMQNTNLSGPEYPVFYTVHISFKKFTLTKASRKDMISETNYLLKFLGFITYIVRDKGNAYLGLDIVIPCRQNISVINIQEIRSVLAHRIEQRAKISEYQRAEYDYQKAFSLLLINLTKKTGYNWFDWYERNSKDGADIQLVFCCKLRPNTERELAKENIKIILALTDNDISTIYLEEDHDDRLLLICNDVAYLKKIDFSTYELPPEMNDSIKKEPIDMLGLTISSTRPIHPSPEEIEQTDNSRRKAFREKRKESSPNTKIDLNHHPDQAEIEGIKREASFLGKSQYVLFKKDELEQMSKDIKDSTIEKKILTELRGGDFFSNNTRQKLGIKVYFERESKTILFRIKAHTSKRPIFQLEEESNEAHYVRTKCK